MSFLSPHEPPCLSVVSQAIAGARRPWICGTLGLGALKPTILDTGADLPFHIEIEKSPTALVGGAGLGGGFLEEAGKSSAWEAGQDRWQPGALGSAQARPGWARRAGRSSRMRSLRWAPIGSHWLWLGSWTLLHRQQGAVGGSEQGRAVTPLSPEIGQALQYPLMATRGGHFSRFKPPWLLDTAFPEGGGGQGPQEVLTPSILDQK